MSSEVLPLGSSRSSQPLAPAAHASALASSASPGEATCTRRRTKASVTLLLLLLLPGCYYAHLGSGQARLLLGREDIDTLLADPTTPSELRAPLQRVKAVRRFASELGLDVGDRYTSYVEWPGDRIVTTVVATAPGEIEPTPFGFPIVGEVPYKGFFDPSWAEAEAAKLGADGYDVCLVPVSAYSTLGWFDDPVTTPLLQGDPGELVETLLHELVHATVFTPSEARFNEGVATFVGQEAARIARRALRLALARRPGPQSTHGASPGGDRCPAPAAGRCRLDRRGDRSGRCLPGPGRDLPR
jgi:predicted aminopeptidase